MCPRITGLDTHSDQRSQVANKRSQFCCPLTPFMTHAISPDQSFAGLLLAVCAGTATLAGAGGAFCPFIAAWNVWSPLGAIGTGPGMAAAAAAAPGFIDSCPCFCCCCSIRRFLNCCKAGFPRSMLPFFAATRIFWMTAGLSCAGLMPLILPPLRDIWVCRRRRAFCCVSCGR